MSDGESDDSQPDEVVVDQHEEEEAAGQDASSRLPSSTSTRKLSRYFLSNEFKMNSLVF